MPRPRTVLGGALPSQYVSMRSERAPAGTTVARDGRTAATTGAPATAQVLLRRPARVTDGRTAMPLTKAMVIVGRRERGGERGRRRKERG